MVSSNGSRPTKATRGRQKIEIKRRESIDDRRVTFTKRRTGLFEKAAELCILCGAKVLIITFSEGRKAFCFGHPDVDALLDSYCNDTAAADAWDGSCSGIGDRNSNAAYSLATSESKQGYLETLKQLEKEKAEKANGKFMTQERSSTGGAPWWDLPIDEMGQEELEFHQKSLEKFKETVTEKHNLGPKQEKSSMVLHRGSDNGVATTSDGQFVQDHPLHHGSDNGFATASNGRFVQDHPSCLSWSLLSVENSSVNHDQMLLNHNMDAFCDTFDPDSKFQDMH